MFVLLDVTTDVSAPASETLFRDEWTFLPGSSLRQPKSKRTGVVVFYFTYAIFLSSIFEDIQQISQDYKILGI